GAVRSVVDVEDVDADGVVRRAGVLAAEVGVARVRDLEREGREGRTGEVDGGQVGQCADVGHRDVAEGGQVGRSELDAADKQLAGVGRLRQAGDDQVREGVFRGVVGIVEAEIGGRERLGALFGGGDGVIGGRGLGANRCDVDRHQVRNRVEISAAVGEAAVVLYLEG